MFKGLLLNMLQLLLSPAHGWEDIALDADNAANAATDAPIVPMRQFLLLLALVSLSWCIQPFYHPAMSFWLALELAVLTFAVFTVAYYGSTFILSVGLQGMVPPAALYEERISLLTVYSLSLLAVILLIKNCLPSSTPVLWFMPLYVGAIIWKGSEFIGVRPGRSLLYVAVAVPAVLALPLALGFLFTKILM